MKRLFTFLFLLFLCLSVSAQDQNEVLITESFSDQNCEQILKTIQDKYKISFFYKALELPRKTYNLSFTDAPLSEVMESLFLGSPMSFISYRDYAYVIMPEKIVNEVYTIDYYKRVEGIEEAVESVEIRSIGNVDQLDASGNATITGYVYDDQTDEPIIGASVVYTETNQGTITDTDGKFTLQVPAGIRELKITYLGYQDYTEELNIQSSGNIELRVEKAAVNLDEVTISAESPDAKVEGVQIGVATLDIKNIEKLPSFMGESDVVKSLLLTAGVSTIGEGAGGFNVRGGEVDQNLILQDAGFLFNSSHALGFFSTFHSELISKVDLFKGNIPAQYGGRLASVMDVTMRNGSFNKFKIKGSVGPVSSKIMVEGPIISEKTSFIGGFRSSYTDWVLQRIQVDEVKNSSAFFDDMNLRLTHKFNNRNSLSISGYNSKDKFTYNNEFGFEYSTRMAQMELRNSFGESILSKFSATTSMYESTQFDLQGLDGSQLDNNISYIKLKEQITYFRDEELKIDVGGSAIQYTIDPGSRFPYGNSTEVEEKILEEEKSRELTGFFNLEYSFSDRLLMSGGLRFTYYQYLGPQNIYEYQNPERPEVEEITGSSIQDGVITTYNSLEPRFSLRFKLTDDLSLKGGYSRTAQFINQVFNTDSPTPTSQWQLSTPYINPNRSHNVSVGLFRNFDDNNIETSIEVYGRQIDQLYDYKDFAQLVVNDHIETELLFGEGRAYGVELSAKKKVGELNGSIGYTLSRTERKIEGINGGKYFPSNFDKTHDLSILLNYQPNQRNTLTLNFTYGTGRPTTAPIGNYITQEGLVVPIFSERNQLRIPAYHRLDFAYTLGKGYKKDQKIRTSWTFGVYNIYNRKNAFSVFFTQDGFGRPVANRLAILGSAFPSLTLNIELL